MLKNPIINAQYQSKANEEEAKKWLLKQAIFTLMYNHEERVEMSEKNEDI